MHRLRFLLCHALNQELSKRKAALNAKVVCITDEAVNFRFEEEKA